MTEVDNNPFEGEQRITIATGSSPNPWLYWPDEEPGE